LQVPRHVILIRSRALGRSSTLPRHVICVEKLNNAPEINRHGSDTPSVGGLPNGNPPGGASSLRSPKSVETRQPCFGDCRHLWRVSRFVSPARSNCDRNPCRS